MRPSLCFFENVEGHITLGLSDVIEDLAGLGYRTTWILSSAAEVGAPHQRKRIFILAECRSERSAARISRSVAWQEGIAGIADNGGDQAWPSRPGEHQFWWEPPRVVNANNDRRICNVAGTKTEPNSNGEEDGLLGAASAMGNTASKRPDACGPEPARQQRPTSTSSTSSPVGHSADPRQPERGSGTVGECGGAQSELERPDGGTNETEREAQSPLGGNLDGPSGGVGYAELCVTCDNRTDELRLLGNGVVPRTCELTFRLMLGELMS